MNVMQRSYARWPEYGPIKRGGKKKDGTSAMTKSGSGREKNAQNTTTVLTSNPSKPRKYNSAILVARMGILTCLGWGASWCCSPTFGISPSCEAPVHFYRGKEGTW